MWVIFNSTLYVISPKDCMLVFTLPFWGPARCRCMFLLRLPSLLASPPLCLCAAPFSFLFLSQTDAGPSLQVWLSCHLLGYLS